MTPRPRGDEHDQGEQSVSVDKCISAHTAPGGDYPAYYSLNQRHGETVLTVRSSGHQGSSLASVALSDIELQKLAFDILDHLYRPKCPLQTA